MRPTRVVHGYRSQGSPRGSRNTGEHGLLVSALALVETARGLGDRSRDGRLELERLAVMCVSISRGLRSGLPIETALAQAVDGLEGRVRARFVRVLDEIEAGRPLADVVDDWIRGADRPSERLVGQSIRLASSTGGDLALCMDTVAISLREQIAVESRRRVLTAQATASARVLVTLPLVFAVVSSVLRGGLIHRGASGLLLATIGLSLDGVGLLWMRRLRRGLR